MTKSPKGLSPSDREKIFRVKTAYTLVEETKSFFFQRLLAEITGHADAEEFSVKMQCSKNFLGRLREDDPSKHTKRMLVSVPLIFGASLLQTIAFLTVAGQTFSDENAQDLAYLTLIARHCGEKQTDGALINELNKELDNMGYPELQFGSLERETAPLVHRETGKVF